MASLIPETATRLQAFAFVNGAELENIHRDGIIRAHATKMAERALRKLLHDCVKTEDGYMGYQGQTLRLDVYVLQPQELHQMLADARMQGEKDALFWNQRMGLDSRAE